ncbi:MAG TPA: hypothetical protein VFP68_19190 [Burkholderiaceae bacterium]|nr:hypothetical protein [Burkholderiaceae bacterium]
MRKKKALSVRERIDATLKLALRDNPNARMSVSELSRLADVSRANLYTSHRDVVASLRSKLEVNRRRGHRTDSSETLQQVRKELQAEVGKNRALAYLVIELRAELQRLRAEIAGQESAEKSAKKTQRARS